MHPTTFLFALVQVLAFALDATLATPLGTRAVPFKSSPPFFDPRAGGGSMLDRDHAHGMGEPLNVIISGRSSPAVLADDGLINYARAIGFSTECMGIHLGAPQTANLGDGHGDVDQTLELRQHFGNLNYGTCIETIVGGNHFRVFRQNGPSANSGALFLAVSLEEDMAHKHTITPNGYDVGRNRLVAAAKGITSYGRVTYSTVVEYLDELLPVGSKGINHNIAIDGRVALLTVTIQ